MSIQRKKSLNSSLRLVGRYTLRITIVLAAMYVLIALAVVFLQSAGYVAPVVVLGLGLAALIQWPRIRVGWIVAATFGLALICGMTAPTISDWRLALMWQAELAFTGAALGMLIATACVLGITRSRFRVWHLLELTVAFSLVLAFYLAYRDAHTRNEHWELAAASRSEQRVKARALKIASLTVALETAFQASSHEQRAQFFAEWHKSISTKSLDEIDDPLERDLYSLYTAFFDPFALSTLSGYESGENVQIEWDYLVLQDSINYRVGESRPEQRRTLVDFRPRVHFDGVETVFLTSAYREVLETFLNRGIDDEDIGRYKFLRPMIWIFPGHGCHWELLSAPSIDEVVFNEERTEAAVYFTLVAEGGVAKMKRQGDVWTLVDSSLGWCQ